MDPNPLARALRAADPEILALVREALEDGETIAGVAKLCDLAGASSIWRIAYCTPALRVVLIEAGRRKGSPKRKVESK